MRAFDLAKPPETYKSLLEAQDSVFVLECTPKLLLTYSEYSDIELQQQDLSGKDNQGFLGFPEGEHRIKDNPSIQEG